MCYDNYPKFFMQEICVPDLFLGLFFNARGGDMLSAISFRISKGSVKKNVYSYLFIWKRQIDVATSTKLNRTIKHETFNHFF